MKLNIKSRRNEEDESKVWKAAVCGVKAEGISYQGKYEKFSVDKNFL